MQLSKEQKKLRAAYLQVFETANGRAVLKDLRDNFHERKSFVAGDPYSTAFNEGRREAYLYIFGMIKLGIATERGKTNAGTVDSDATESEWPDEQ